MGDYQRINPLKLYENSFGTLPVLNKFSGLGVGANYTIVAAVTGYRVRVMGLIAQSNNAAQGTLQLLDGSGGTPLYSYVQPTNAQPPEKLPLDPAGYFETSTGVGLFATILTQAIVCNVSYILYKPD